MSEHTKGRIEAFTQESFSGWYALRDADHFEVGSGDGGFEEDDARRLAACWNACEGLDTAQLEALPEPFAGLALGDLMAVRKELATARAQNEKLLAMVQEQDRMLGNKACATKECRELLAARALLCEAIEWVELEHGGKEFASKLQNWLDACDTLGSGNG